MSAPTVSRQTWRESMTVTVPAGKSGKVEVCRFTVTEQDASFGALRSFHTGRFTPAGEYTALYRSGYLWMSDTPDEQRDHYAPIREAQASRARRVLINGLGLGMVVAAMLTIDHVEHVDVVELDPDVVALVGPHYEQMAADMGKTVKIHLGDAYKMTWPAGVRWDLAWSDIWPDLCTDNLDGMTRLSRKYGRRVNWHGHWGRELLLARRRREQRSCGGWKR
jgi:hypothetical protein